MVYIPETSVSNYSMERNGIHAYIITTSGKFYTPLEEMFSPNDGDIFPCVVMLNGKRYETSIIFPGYTDFYIGNTKLYGQFYDYNFAWVQDTGEPFCIWLNSGGGEAILANTKEDVYTFSVMEMLEPDSESVTYRWQVQDNSLVSVGKNSNEIGNVLGSITDGVYTTFQSRLATPFNLLHDKEWAIEFRMQFVRTPSPPMSKVWDDGSKWSVVARNGSKSISICYRDSSHTHYGVKLDGYGIDLYAEHLYRLHNRVNADGTNMVYLYVDGAEIAPLTNKFTASSDLGIDDYLSGKDISFGFMGANSYTLDGFTMTDIAVWESGADEAFAPPTEEEPIDYKAMVQGWIIGKRLAAMRKIVARPESEYVAVFAGGELYIKKAPAVMDGNVLSLSGLDL